MLGNPHTAISLSLSINLPIYILKNHVNNYGKRKTFSKRLWVRDKTEKEASSKLNRTTKSEKDDDQIEQKIEYKIRLDIFIGIALKLLMCAH